MPEPTPQLLRTVELLQDGEWHDLEWLIREAGKAITPGIAVRELERRRRNTYRKKTGRESVQRTAGHEADRRVESGRRLLILATLRGVSFQLDPPATGGRTRVLGRRVRMVSVPPIARSRLRKEQAS